MGPRKIIMAWGKKLATWAAAAAIIGFVAGASMRFAIAESDIAYAKDDLEKNALAHQIIFESLNRFENRQIKNTVLLELMAEKQGIRLPDRTSAQLAREQE
jgi:hypothetical protein